MNDLQEFISNIAEYLDQNDKISLASVNRTTRELIIHTLLNDLSLELTNLSVKKLDSLCRVLGQSIQLNNIEIIIDEPENIVTHSLNESANKNIEKIFGIKNDYKSVVINEFEINEIIDREIIIKAITPFLIKNNNLENLNIFLQEITSIEMYELSKTLKINSTLQRLQFGTHHIDRGAIHILADAIANNTSLTALNLDGMLKKDSLKKSNSGWKLDDIFEAVLVNTTLKTLRIGESQVIISNSFYKKSIMNSTLENLILNDNSIEDLSMPLIFNFVKSCRYLKTLSFSNSGLNDENLTILLDALVTNSQLQSINLSENKITNAGLINLAQFVNDSKITLINLNNNLYNQNGIYSFINDVKRNTSKKMLILWNNS